MEGAESVGRDAISAVKLIKAGTLATLFTGYYSSAMAQGGNAEFWRTSSSLTVDTTCASTDTTKRFDWANCSAAATSAYGNNTNPRYVIERLPDVTSVTPTETWYRVTTRASGGSNQADVILQILYTPP